ncbi:hypothetical protein VKT23_016078 [Stygiomarasmius scandens]|uniref:Uncharacterized protein n=1 Tax=Marasmiellus scandens TaxID=2682957 RepID=A0ABR1IW01_9AGAR
MAQPSPPDVSPSQNSAPDQPSVVTSSGIQLRHDADLLIRHFLPPSPQDSVPGEHPESEDQISLPLPLCIPQISVSAEWDSAFARGYNDNLHSLGISQQILLDFIDGLNLAMAASPPLRVVSAVGRIIGFVPYHWAMIAGTVITVTAETGIRVLSKTPTDRFLRAANLNLFHPRGLSVRLCTTSAMLLLLSGTENVPNKSKTKEKLNKFGRGVGSVLLKSPIPIPLANPIIRAIADKPAPVPVGETIEGSVLRRRLALVQEPGLALPLRFDGMPPPAKPKGVMDRMSSLGVKADGWMETRKERRNEERRRILKKLDDEDMEMRGMNRGLLTRLTSSGSDIGRRSPGVSGRNDRQHSTDHNPEPGSNSGTTDAVARSSNSSSFSFKGMASRATSYLDEYLMQREIAREKMVRSRNAFGGPLTTILGPSETPMQKKIAQEDLLERWATDKVLWIVIMNAENDGQIENIELAESIDEEERVDEETWRAEMVHERQELEEEREVVGGLQST